jgi:recombinase-like zinc beta ribbon protein
LRVLVVDEFAAGWCDGSLSCIWPGGGQGDRGVVESGWVPRVCRRMRLSRIGIGSGWVAALGCRRDPREQAVHRIRHLRALAEGRGVARSGGCCRGLHCAVSAVAAGEDRAIAGACASGDCVGGDVLRLSWRSGRGVPAGWSAMSRQRVSKKRTYELRGRIRCGICDRKMEGAARHQEVKYYRCNARTMVPESATALAHPQQIYLREDLVTPAINRWIGELFGPLNRQVTIDLLLEGDDSSAASRRACRAVGGAGCGS